MAAKDLSKMTKAELLELAGSRKLDVTPRMLKSELIEAIRKSRKTNVAKRTSPKTARAKASKQAVKKKTTRKPARAKGDKKAVRKKSVKSKAAVTTKRAGTAGKAKRIDTHRAPASREKKIEARTIRQKAVASKYYLGAEEKVMPPVDSLDIPDGYNVDRIVVLVRDPYWIFTYWEVTQKRFRELERLFGGDWPECRLILRVYDRSSETESYFDIALSGEARNWYINVTPQRRYQVAIGALGPDGRFECAAISNTVETPRAGVSDVIDDRWMVPEEIFDRIFAASGGHDMQASSEELRELLERRLLEQIGSGAVSSFASGVPPQIERERGFRLWVTTELILYGATEPDAKVTVQGKEIELRGDGTFSLRYELPDGRIELPVTAVSGDGLEERTIETAVSKKSKRKEPVPR